MLAEDNIPRGTPSLSEVPRVVHGRKTKRPNQDASVAPLVQSRQSLPASRDAARAQSLLDAVASQPALVLLPPDQGPRHQQTRAVARGAFAQLRRQLRACLDEAPIEDGRSHPGEELLEQALIEASGPEIVVKLITSEPDPSFSAAALKLLARVGGGLSEQRRAELVEFGLRSPSIELREAAAEAVEQWEDVALLPMLYAHKEPARWLRAYIKDIIDDISG